MTNQEAITILKSVERYGIEAEAVNLAIDALEQYDSMAETVNKVSELLRKKRPKGEWNEIQAGMFACPFCGARPHKDFKNFCAKCGAKMKGGAE